MNVSVHRVNVCACTCALYDYQCALYEGMCVCVCCYLVNKSEAKRTMEVQAIRKKVVIFVPDLDAAAPSSWNARELGR